MCTTYNLLFFKNIARYSLYLCLCYHTIIFPFQYARRFKMKRVRFLKAVQQQEDVLAYEKESLLKIVQQREVSSYERRDIIWLLLIYFICCSDWICFLYNFLCICVDEVMNDIINTIKMTCFILLFLFWSTCNIKYKSMSFFPKKIFSVDIDTIATRPSYRCSLLVSSSISIRYRESISMRWIIYHWDSDFIATQLASFIAPCKHSLKLSPHLML